MIHPVFRGNKYILLSILACFIVGAIQAIIFMPALQISVTWLLLDGCISWIVYFAISIPLWMIAAYVDFSKNSRLQNAINFIALGIVSISIWLLISGILVYTFLPDSAFTILQNTFAIRIVLGILVYIIILQHVILQLYPKNKDTDNDEEIAQIQNIETELPLQAKEFLTTISVKQGQKISVIKVEDIWYLQAEGDYVMIYTKESKYLKEQTMKYFEENLPKSDFSTIHRSTIVNIHCISSVQLYEKQNYIVVLKNTTSLKVSTTGYKILKLNLGL